MRWSVALLCSICMVGCTYDFDTYLPVASVAGDAGGADAASDAPSDSDAGCTGSNARVFQGHCYFALTSESGFDAAQSACVAAGAHLATLTSAEEEAFVEGIRAGRDRWIGLRRADSAPPSAPASFTWITGETSSFMKWSTGEPNNSGACARLRASNDWGDQSCTTNNEAICERD